MARGDVLGVDTFIGPNAAGQMDMASNGRSATGVELARNEMLSRCLCDTLPCIGAVGGVLDFGIDLRRLVGAAMDESDADALAGRLVVVFNRSARLDAGATRVQVQLARTGAAYAFTVDADARTAPDGIPINLRLGVTALTVEALAQGGGV